MSPSIRIAIIGGGVAGAFLLHALLKFPHLDVHIFESAAEFKEAGMAFGIARNAQAALELICPSAAQCLDRAGAVPTRGVRFMMAQGEWSGTMADEVDDVKVDGDVPITLSFADGTTHECDIFIGTDGVHSTVRKRILGENNSASSPKNTGGWFLMTLQPYDKARSSMGPELIDIDDARDYAWAGQNTFLMHNILSGVQLVQFAIASFDKEAESGSVDLWQRNVGVDEIKKMYQDWPSHLNKAVNELLCNQPEHKASYLWDNPEARSYVSSPICVTGDAAHSTTP